MTSISKFAGLVTDCFVSQVTKPYYYVKQQREISKFFLLSPFNAPEGWEFYVQATGFGFDSNTNDYKVVAFLTLNQRYSANYIDAVEIYNLSTNSWREIDQNHYMPYIDNAPTGFGTLINGAIHWLASCEEINFCILSFGMSTELFRYIELPVVEPGEEKRMHLVVLNESLALWAYREFWDYSDPEQQQIIDIWLMQQYGVEESWTKQVTIGPLFGINRPLLMWKNEAILLEKCGSPLVSCALDTHEMNDFDIHGIRETLRVMVYQESLVSII